MGSYGPAVIASDAHRHRVEICGVKCSTGEDEADDTVRLGYRYVKGRGESPGGNGCRKRVNKANVAPCGTLGGAPVVEVLGRCATTPVTKERAYA